MAASMAWGKLGKEKVKIMLILSYKINVTNYDLICGLLDFQQLTTFNNGEL